MNGQATFRLGAPNRRLVAFAEALVPLDANSERRSALVLLYVLT